LNVWVPPQDDVTVNVPVAGGLVKLTFPFNENWFDEHAVGVAVIPEIEQLHAAGAV
jgi:hypothetical protein